MRIGIAGPIASSDVRLLLDDPKQSLPMGYGGAPLVATLIRALLNRGHTVYAYTTSSDIPIRSHISATGRRFKITFCGSRRRAFRYANGTWGRAMDGFRMERDLLAKMILTDGPDLVHAHWSYEFGLAALETGLPHLVTCHDVPQEVLRHMPGPYRLVRYFMARKCLSIAETVTAVSPYVAEKVQGLSRASITVVPNPLPDEALAISQSGLTRTGVPSEPIIAMVLNGWSSLKNGKAALQAFRVLRESIPRARLRAYGAGFGSGEAAEDWARRNGLATGVSFLGSIPHSSLLQELRRSHLLIHPSLVEGCPMAIAEAMACGMPVVGGAQSGGVPWMVGGAGVLTNVKSSNALASAMLKVLSNQDSYKDYSALARENARAFQSERITEAYEALYSRAIETSTNVPPSEEAGRQGIR